MAPNRKKRARSLESHDSDTELRRHSEKRVKKHAQKVKRRGKKRRSDDSDSDSSESDSDSSGTESDVDEEFKAAARAITRCVDMFCNVEKVIQVVMYIGQEEASRSGELEEDEVDRTRRKKFLNELSSQTTERYKRGYDMLLHLAPSLKELIGNASKKQELKKVTQAMNSVIKLTRSDDCSRLRDKIGHYAAPNPAEAALSPPIYIGGTSRSHMGLNHPVLARFLCPISALVEFDNDPERTRQKLLSGKITMPSDIYPVFSWSGDPPADDFQEEDIYEGLFKGYLLERVMRHIFTGPSTALGEESRATRACNAELHDMAKVEAAHIAYGCVLARFGITSKNRWSEKDGQFSYRRFYYHVLDDIESNDDQAWKDAILRHHNMVLFKHERGRNAGSGSHSDGHRSPASESSSDPFLVKMRAQAAARASAAGSKSSDASVPSERRGPSAVVITPPPSSPRPSSPPPPPPPPSPPPPSPPRGREPSPPPSGPQGVLDLSELSELDEDMSTAKTKANSKSRPTKKAKNLAVVSDDEDKETPEDPGAQKSRKQPKRGGRRKGRK